MRALKLDGVLVRVVDNARAKMDKVAAQIVHPKHKINIISERVESMGALLKSYSYHGVLERGFALVKGVDGTPITRAANAKDGQEVELVFFDDNKKATIGGDKSGGGQGSLF